MGWLSHHVRGKWHKDRNTLENWLGRFFVHGQHVDSHTFSFQCSCKYQIKWLACIYGLWCHGHTYLYIYIHMFHKLQTRFWAAEILGIGKAAGTKGSADCLIYLPQFQWPGLLTVGLMRVEAPTLLTSNSTPTLLPNAYNRIIVDYVSAWGSLRRGRP